MAYNSFNRGNNNDDRRSSNRPAPQLHPATCHKCGKSCMVPFVATGNRPILCRDCFKAEGGMNERRGDDRRSSSPMNRDRRMFDAVCDQCGNRCQVPFQPREGKEVLCSHCFEKKGKDERINFERSNASVDLSAVNAKLDKILSLLSTMEIVLTPQQSEIVTNIIEEEAVSEEPMNEKPVKAAKPARKKAAAKKPSTKKRTSTKKSS